MEKATISYYSPGTRVMAKDYKSHARDLKSGIITSINVHAINLRDDSIDFSVSYNVTLDRTTAKGKPVRVSTSTVELIDK
jgi:hypothetical protein